MLTYGSISFILDEIEGVDHIVGSLVLLKTITHTDLNIIDFQNRLSVAIYLGCRHCDVCTIAVKTSRLNDLKYALKAGCPFVDDICEIAARYDSLDCLRYLRNISAPWNERVPYIASERGNFECLKYCVNEGCPINVLRCMEVGGYLTRKWLTKKLGVFGPKRRRFRQTEIGSINI